MNAGYLKRHKTNENQFFFFFCINLSHTSSSVTGVQCGDHSLPDDRYNYFFSFKAQESPSILHSIYTYDPQPLFSGTIILFYCPFYGHELYQSFSGQDGPPVLSWLCLLLLMCRFSPANANTISLKLQIQRLEN